MSVNENIAKFIENVCNDDSHGYNQEWNDRWGTPDYDCSGLAITACEESGVPVKSNGGTYTGNMPEACEASGMRNVIDDVNIVTGKGLLRGDVLINRQKHTVVYLGNNLVGGARINEKGTATGGQKGDQNGKEICIHSYYNYPWTHVYRYPVTENISSDIDLTLVAKDVIAGKYGNGQKRIDALTAKGYNYNQVQSVVNLLLTRNNNPSSDIRTIAEEVIHGDWGNGKERIQRLTEAGYNYNEVQEMVNSLL